MFLKKKTKLLLTEIAQKGSLWLLRESISASLKKEGLDLLKYDISIPMPFMYKIVQLFRERLAHIADTNIYGFGHMGDGKLTRGNFGSFTVPQITCT